MNVSFGDWKSELRNMFVVGNVLVRTHGLNVDCERHQR